METRAIQTPLHRDDNKIAGYAAVFNVPTEIMDVSGRKFREVIRPGAFRESIEAQQDCRCLVNHNPDNLLGRTKSNTLKLWEDDKGLRFECELPSTQTARDVAESIRRGDLDGCSFGFTVNEDKWVDDNGPMRELRNVNLFDVSVVTYPAYKSGTSVDLRSVQIPLCWNVKMKLRKMRMRMLDTHKGD